jgi:thiamine biosynthesis lipoprotein
MGTYASISLENNASLAQKGFKLIKDIENSLSSYKKASVISRLNRYKYANLDSYTYEALSLSKKYYQQSGSYFNVAVGSLTKDIYRFGQRREFIAHHKVLKERELALNSLQFNQSEAKIASSIKIDLGGMGKGYAVDKVKELFLQEGIKKAKIALSGDIACIGVCEVFVQNPFEDDSLLFKLRTKKDLSSISTSGSYNRFVGSEINNHLIDPISKRSQNYFSSITLISQLPNADIDAYATAASVMAKDKSIKFLDAQDLGYILITRDKEIIVSENIEQFCELLIVDNVEKEQGGYIYYH